MGVESPYWAEGIDHIQAMVNEMNDMTDTGELLQATIEQLFLELGTGDGFEADLAKFHGIATAQTWILHTWRFISKNKISFKPPAGQLCLRRVNDQFLMKAFGRHISSQAELRSINRCRLYLQVNTLADIATGDGRMVSPTVINHQ